MRGRRPGKTGGLFAGIHRGFFRAENDADGRGSFAAVERALSDRLQMLGKSVTVLTSASKVPNRFAAASRNTRWPSGRSLPTRGTRWSLSR